MAVLLVLFDVGDVPNASDAVQAAHRLVGVVVSLFLAAFAARREVLVADMPYSL